VIVKVFRISELAEYSFMAVFKMEKSFEEETLDLNVFVCSDDLLCRESSPSCVPGEQVGRYVLCGTTPDPVSLQGDLPAHDETDFTIYPTRVLETVASLQDLEVYSTDPGINLHAYYRADTVAMIFNSESVMDRAINMVVTDVNKHVKAVNGKSLDTEIKSYNQLTDDALRDYFFRG
jgi:hypothetical protein